MLNHQERCQNGRWRAWNKTCPKIINEWEGMTCWPADSRKEYGPCFQGFHKLSYLLLFLAVPPGLWDLSSQTGIGPMPPAMEVQNLNHWAVREVPRLTVDLMLLPHLTEMTQVSPRQLSHRPTKQQSWEESTFPNLRHLSRATTNSICLIYLLAINNVFL